MTTLNKIQKFLEPRKMAIAGVSRNPKKFGAYVFAELKKKGFELYPINPNTDVIQGLKCYKSVDDLPADVKHLFIVTPKEEAESIVLAAVNKGIEMIWIQQKSETPEAVRIIEKAHIPLIYNRCLMMFAEPVTGGHNIHRFFVKVFGTYPKLVYSAN